MSETSDDDGEQSSFEAQLETIHQQHLRQDLEEQLEDAATTMEETILQTIIADEFLGVDVAVSDDVRDQIETARNHVTNRDFDALDSMIDDLIADVESEARTIENTIQEERSEDRDRITAMRELNEHVNAADPGKLKALESLLSDWNWKAQVHTEEVGESFDAKQEVAHEFATSMSQSLTDVQEALLGNYSGTTLGSVVNQLMDDESLHYTDLTDEEKDALQGSKLAEYIELRLASGNHHYQQD